MEVPYGHFMTSVDTALLCLDFQLTFTAPVTFDLLSQSRSRLLFSNTIYFAVRDLSPWARMNYLAMDELKIWLVQALFRQF